MLTPLSKTVSTKLSYVKRFFKNGKSSEPVSKIVVQLKSNVQLFNCIVIPIP